MKNRFGFILRCAVLAAVSCFQSGRPPRAADDADQPRLTQINLIDTLLAGLYDGATTFGELKRYGDFGLGTVDKLDGEMLMLDGVAYQIKADGEVHVLPDVATTPFAVATHFKPNASASVEKKDYAGVCGFLDGAARNPNVFVAFSLTGTFALMHTRSVPAQTPPYAPLAKVTENQAEFRMEMIRGTLVGFRSPAFAKGMNVPGYHIHFISEDRRRGGHVLGFRLLSGDLRWSEIRRFEVLLSDESEAFAKLDLDKDRAKELKEAESPRGDAVVAPDEGETAAASGIAANRAAFPE